MTGCDFSPDGTLLSTGTSVKKGLGQPTLDFFSLRTNSKVASLPLDGTGVVPIVWHPRINQVWQILYGNSDSKVYTLYDPSISEKGAMLCSVKAAPKRGVLSYGADAFSQVSARVSSTHRRFNTVLFRPLVFVREDSPCFRRFVQHLIHFLFSGLLRGLHDRVLVPLMCCLTLGDAHCYSACASYVSRGKRRPPQAAKT
eukprot:scaffold60180_cov30-Tisochrysis_lutea.AAC.4